MAVPNLKCLISRENLHQIGTLFFLHGDGYTAESSRKLLRSLLHREFEFDHLRVIYPQAPDIAYRVATGGEEKGMWYERNTFSPTDWERMDSINYSCTLISQLINQEKSRGIPLQNIIVGGFGMGGIIAMHTAYRFHPEIAGVFTHSSILSPRSIVLETIRTDLQLNKDKKFPALWMWYGRKDKNWLRWAVHTAECFMDLKIQTNFQVNYAMQGHEIIPDEVNYLKEWVEQIIPNPGRGIEKETS